MWRSVPQNLNLSVIIVLNVLKDRVSYLPSSLLPGNTCVITRQDYDWYIVQKLETRYGICNEMVVKFNSSLIQHISDRITQYAEQ